MKRKIFIVVKEKDESFVKFGFELDRHIINNCYCYTYEMCDVESDDFDWNGVFNDPNVVSLSFNFIQ